MVGAPLSLPLKANRRHLGDSGTKRQPRPLYLGIGFRLNLVLVAGRVRSPSHRHVLAKAFATCTLFRSPLVSGATFL